MISTDQNKFPPTNEHVPPMKLSPYSMPISHFDDACAVRLLVSRVAKLWHFLPIWGLFTLCLTRFYPCPTEWAYLQKCSQGINTLCLNINNLLNYNTSRSNDLNPKPPNSEQTWEPADHRATLAFILDTKQPIKTVLKRKINKPMHVKMVFRFTALCYW